MQRCLSVDWLSIMVGMPRKNYETYKCKYKIVLDDKNTRHFKQIHYIYAPDGDEIGYVSSDPCSGILAHDMGLLKLNNKYLYQTELKRFVVQLLKDLGMQFRSISRLDIALDFQRFNNNLDPKMFVKKYISDVYLRRCRGSSSDWGCRGKEGNNKGKKYESLTWGSKKSDVQFQIYNKTQEMADVKRKEWIVDNWKANGYDNEEDVWRIEFRLSKTKNVVFNTDSGEQIFDMTTLDCLDNIKDVYSYLFHRYFSFVRNEKKIRKDRCKPLVLFSKGFETRGVSIKLSEKKEADRAARVFAKHLTKLEQEMSGLDIMLSIFVNEFAGYYIQSRGLKSWAENKLNYKLSERQQELWNSRRISTLLSEAAYMRLHVRDKDHPNYSTHNVFLTNKNRKPQA